MPDAIFFFKYHILLTVYPQVLEEKNQNKTKAHPKPKNEQNKKKTTTTWQWNATINLIQTKEYHKF